MTRLNRNPPPQKCECKYTLMSITQHVNDQDRKKVLPWFTSRLTQVINADQSDQIITNPAQVLS